MNDYAKIVVKGSPITKSNFKLHNSNGRAILPNSSGKSHDRYALYEQEIALIARSQNPDTVFCTALIAVLKVFYKSEKRHPDTINITKSIFDGIEKSGIIVNDAQITKIITEEYYDKENPRFELELFPESNYELNYSLKKKEIPSHSKVYSSFKKAIKPKNTTKPEVIASKENNIVVCEYCKKTILSNDYIVANNGKTIICRKCFSKLL